MKRSFQILLILSALLQNSLEAANVIPPFDGAAPIPATQVKDDQDKDFELVQTLKQKAAGPIVLLPIFARCKGACPALAQALRLASSSLEEGMNNVTVVIYSFDPEDSAESLQSFRNIQRLPSNWLMFHSKDQDAKRFYDSLRYIYRDEDGDFIHPNQFFVLNKNMEWKATVVGTDFEAKELAQALELAGEKMSFFKRVFLFPETLAIFSGISLFVIVFGLVIFTSLRKKKPSA